MESPEEFYRQLEKMRLEFRDLGYNLIKLIEEYQKCSLCAYRRKPSPPKRKKPMHAELGGFWFNLLLAITGFLYGSYRLAKRAREEERLKREHSQQEQAPSDSP